MHVLWEVSLQNQHHEVMHCWKSSLDLNLQGVLKYEWNGYVQGILHCGLNLTKEDDMLALLWNEELEHVIAKVPIMQSPSHILKSHKGGRILIYGYVIYHIK